MVPKKWDIQKEPGLVSGSSELIDSDPEDIVGWSWVWKMGSETNTWKECIQKSNEHKRRNAKEMERKHNQSLNRRLASNDQWVAKEENYGHQFYEEWHVAVNVASSSATAARMCHARPARKPKWNPKLEKQLAQSIKDHEVANMDIIRKPTE